MRSSKKSTHSSRRGIRSLSVFILLVSAVFSFINFPASASKSGLQDSRDVGLAWLGVDDKLQMSVIKTALAEPRLLDYHAPTRNLVIASDQPSRLELFAATNQSELLSSSLFSKAGAPKSMAVARDNNPQFAPGELFLGFDRGVILRISTDASEIKETKLPQETAAVVGLIIDETNTFDGDLIAVTGSGKVWRIDASGGEFLLVDLGTSLRGVTIIPNNIEPYGWLAGNLLIGAVDQQGIYTLGAEGHATFFPLGIEVRDMDMITPEENLFAVSTRAAKLFGVGSDAFVDRVGDILITSPDAKGFYLLHWNGGAFQTTPIYVDEEIDQAVFAPISLRDDAGGCVTSLQLSENVFEWEGGEGSFSVLAPSNCNWTASSSSPWLSLLTGQSGTGNGTVTYFVAKNGSYDLREANISVDMLTHRVRQSRKAQLHCILSFNPANPTIPAIGGNGTINVMGSDKCAWQAVSDSPWLTITSSPFGRGNGSITFSVATNFGAQTRQAAISFGRQSGGLAVTQDPNLAPVVNAGADQVIALPSTALLNGSASDDGVGNGVTVSWSKLSGPESVLFSGAQNAANTAIFSTPGIYVLRMTASDGFLTASDDVQITVNPDPVPPPPDPSTTAPPINPTVATNPFDATKFLYTGPNAIQTGVTPGTIKEESVAVLRGRVVSKTGQPIVKAKITILDHPELGQTLTRADGMFDIVVNGGGEINVKYEKLGFMPVQREERSDWQEYDSVEDVVMIPHDGSVTFIDLNSTAPIQVAQSGLITDASGTRRSRLLFKQGTTATMRLPGGSTQPLTAMNVRSTEFTVGANGPETMPGDLPPLSAFTYAAGYTVDEAVAANATEVAFNQSVIQYNENFLNFPVGTNIPSGAFDEITGIWMPSANGRVVKILSITSGAANLDLNGSGNPATDPEYAALGINTAEREQLAALYVVNQSLWRVPVIHFTSWDSNWPYGPPAGAEPPGGDPPQCDT
ncbi:MAG: BACON domain-containing protein [Pyrinomonadaceae bacterium]